VIGVVIANTREQAVYASRKVVVEYEDLPAIISIQDAINAESYFLQPREISSGDILREEGLSDIVVEGTLNVGSQEHFYMETQATVVIPGENGSLEVNTSSQNLLYTQRSCAKILGLKESHVVVKCKRVGGGFGGKETKSAFIACITALSAYHLDRAVSITLDRDVDMSITGQRHSFVFKYKAGCTKDGDLKFNDVTMYNNAGYSLDYSQAILELGMLACDNTYLWRALRARGYTCKTNQESHTAFRGFGALQCKLSYII